MREHFLKIIEITRSYLRTHFVWSSRVISWSQLCDVALLHRLRFNVNIIVIIILIELKWLWCSFAVNATRLHYALRYPFICICSNIVAMYCARARARVCIYITYHNIYHERFTRNIICLQYIPYYMFVFQIFIESFKAKL